MKYEIFKDGKHLDTIERYQNTTILDTRLGVEFAESEDSFNEFINTLQAAGYIITNK